MIVEKQPDTILHLGAGRCSEFPDWDATGARRIILVEADPEKARYLRAAYDQDERVEIVERAVSGTGGTALLRRFNVPRFSSLRKPAELLRLYPSLRTTDEIPVEALSPTALCEQIGVQKINWLLVDVPGEEWTTLREFHSQGLLEECDWVGVSVGDVSLFDGSSTVDEISAELQESGYELISRDDGSDPDRPRLVFRRDLTKLKNRELEKRVEDLAEELNKERDLRICVAAQLDERGREVAALKKERDEQIGTLKEQYEQERTAREAATKQGETYSEQLESLKSERDDLAGRVSELSSQIEERTKEVQQRDEDVRRVQSDASVLREQQGKVNHEILRAEAQIDLIKDVLLSEKSL